MNEFKGTPAPWFVDHKSPFLVRAGDDIDGRHIAHVGPANYTPRFDVDEPNAQLIAAAPELLAAALRVLAKLEHPTAGVTILDEEALRAAIYKATSNPNQTT